MAEITNQELARLPLAEALEFYAPQIRAALPNNIPLDRFQPLRDKCCRVLMIVSRWAADIGSPVGEFSPAQITQLVCPK